MRVDRRTMTYSSLLVAMAILLSVALLQLTQITAQSATLHHPLANDIDYTLTITKTVDSAVPTSDWNFVVEGFGIYSNVTVLAGTTSVNVPLPGGNYTITETLQDGYWIRYKGCDLIDQLDRAPSAIALSNVISDVMVGEFGDRTCGFDNSEYASVTLVKDAIPDSSQPFTLSVYTGVSTQIQLVDDGSGIGNSTLVGSLMVGSPFYVNEDVYATLMGGWVPIDVECTDFSGAVTGTLGYYDVALQIVPGEHYTCTFTNAMPTIELAKTVGTEAGVCASTDVVEVLAGTEVHYCYEATNTSPLTLTKHSLIDSPLGEIFNDLSFDLAPGMSVNNIQASFPVADTPAVSVKNVATWTATMTYTLIDLAAANAEIDIDPARELAAQDGFTLTAVATDTAMVNVIQPGTIIVDKVTDPAGSTQSFDFALTGPGLSDNFSLTDAATPYDSGNLAPASYSVGETPVTGWTTTASCDDGSPVDDINLLPGATITCTFTNTVVPTALDDDDLPSQKLYLPSFNMTQ